MTTEKKPTIHFRFVVNAMGGGHTHVKVWSGTTPYSLGLTGGLVMRNDEWEALQKALGTAKADGVQIHVGEP